jgi:hypothetical protein
MIERLRSGVPLAGLAAALLALFAADNILLLAFLGLPPFVAVLLIALLCPLAAFLTAKVIKSDVIVPWKAILIAASVALILFVLGGQGRFFHATADWQVRDAILADMARFPWPYAYQMDGGAGILRAPLGLYLLPSLAGGGWHEIAMLISNSLRLTLLIALCWPLFAGTRDRIVAGSVFLLFSGFDFIGTVLVNTLGGEAAWTHLERWNFNNQFSSHITQAFWVPQHAIAGWACAVAFLLWHRGYARIGLFAATIPLVAIWSPLAIMGAVPFALLAGVRALRSGDWNFGDVALGALAAMLALPSLAYMQLDAAELGSSAREITVAAYALVILLEVLPLWLPPFLARSTLGEDRPILWVILGCLVVMPLYQIGANSDFQMRGSIMPLALLAVFFADWLLRMLDQKVRSGVVCAIAILAIGAVTPAVELQRSLVLPPSPEPRCSLIGMWDRQQGMLIAPHATYFARVQSMPGWMPKGPVLAGKTDPKRCWSRNWQE